MATSTVSISTTVTPGVTLSNPVSLDELQLLGTPTVTVDSTADISGVVGTAEGSTVILQASNTSDQSVNGDALIAAVAQANSTGGSATEPYVILLYPGEYDLDGSSLTITGSYIHLAGVTGNPYDVVVKNDTATTSITFGATGCHVSGIYFKDGKFEDGSASATGQRTQNCVFDNSAGLTTITSDDLYGNFINCRIESAGQSGAGAPNFHGTLDGCKIGGSDDIGIAPSGIVRNCVIEPTIIQRDGATTASVYQCSLKAAISGLTNDIDTPYNVVDAQVAI